MNFSRHFIAWQQKSLRTYLHDVEAKVDACARSASRILGVTVYIWLHGVYPELRTVAAARGVQPGVVRDGPAAYVTPGLRRLADVRADGHPDVVLLLPATRVPPAAASRCSARWYCSSRRSRELFLLVHPQAVTPVKIGGPGRRQPHRVRGARIRRAVLRHRGHAHVHAAVQRAWTSSARSPRSSRASTTPARVSAWSGPPATTRG